MKNYKFFKVLLFVLVGIASFLPMMSIALAYLGDGGGG